MVVNLMSSTPELILIVKQRDLTNGHVMNYLPLTGSSASAA